MAKLSPHMGLIGKTARMGHLRKICLWPKLRPGAAHTGEARPKCGRVACVPAQQPLHCAQPNSQRISRRPRPAGSLCEAGQRFFHRRIAPCVPGNGLADLFFIHVRAKAA